MIIYERPSIRSIFRRSRCETFPLFICPIRHEMSIDCSFQNDKWHCKTMLVIRMKESNDAIKCSCRMPTHCPSRSTPLHPEVEAVSDTRRKDRQKWVKNIELREIVKCLAFRESNSKSAWNVIKETIPKISYSLLNTFPLNVKFSFSAIFKGVISVSYTHLTLPTICSV